jgi:endo-1,4-beta-xylanase
MKQKLFFRKGMKILSLGIGFSAAILLLLASCSKEDFSKEKTVNLSGYVSDGSHLKSTGSDHGYFWQLYYVGGSASISFSGAGKYAGNFAVSWNGVSDVVAGKGWNPGSTRTINYNCGSLSGGYNFFGVYGWTTNPLIEYYVCEMGSITYGATNVGSVTSDGHSYGLYKHQQVNQPSIIGTATFWQYMSQWGGSSTGSSHAVTMGNHFNAWKSKMGSMGSNNLQILAVEAYGGKSGYCNATVW